MYNDTTRRSSLSLSLLHHPAIGRVLGSGPLELVVSKVEDLTPRIRRFELRSPAGDQLPSWTPGAHIAVPVELETGPATRCYSLHGDCDVRDAYEIAVLRHDEGSGGSQAIHRAFRAGTRLSCENPTNHFGLEAGDVPCILIAGGIGITPLRAMATALARRGTPFVLHYATRSPDETAFMRELSDSFGAKVFFWHSKAAQPQRLDVDAILSGAPRAGLVYVCGPGSLVQAVLDAGARHGLPRGNIRYELFSPVPLSAGDLAFDVVLARSSRVVHVPANKSILDAVLAAGIDAAFGCCAGQCGTCAVTVVEGEVEHRDDVLSDDERAVEKRACICVSRARSSRLVIDL